ncbi:MAG: AI-2E family transporter [Synergistaceae bacterium]|jgi:predicted PurR-regulated permease PerM|nr:AI-2E family transporter [Synergistaceae bacterium]
MMEKSGRKTSVMETCIVVLTVLAVGFVLSKAAQVAIPFTLALILTLLLAPIVKAGQPHKIPPFAMVLLVLACFAAIFLPLGIFISTRMESLVSILPAYYARLVNIGQSVLDNYQVPKEFWVTINWGNTMGRYLSGMTGFMLNWLGKLVMIMVFLIFMLLESPYIDKRIKMAFKGENGEKVSSVADKIVRQISKYLRTLAMISFATGVCVWLALYALGVDFALPWGILAFFLNFIPTLGSIAASIPPILIALVQFYPDGVPAVLTFLALLSIQFTIGNILTPKIMGDALDLSPVVILISLMFWGIIWGVSGALISVPITAMIKIICENIKPLQFLAVLMSSAKTGRRVEEDGSP